MNQNALRVSVRTATSKALKPQWICRQCLATQTQPSSSVEHQQLSTGDLLSRPLPQERLPAHLLQHVNAERLPISEQEQWEKVEPHKRIVGVVMSHGKMDKTVRVRVAGQRWNNTIKKYYRYDDRHLVHDPNNSLVTGDVVELHRLKVSARVEHVVSKIISPFGQPIESRPPVPSPEERLAAYKAKRFVKLERRELRKKAAQGVEEAIQRLKDMGLDPGAGVKPGVGKKENVPKVIREGKTPEEGALLGRKGQKLPQGVLPGGMHEVNDINSRSLHNSRKAIEFEQKAEKNLLEADEKGEKLLEQGLASNSVIR